MRLPFNSLPPASFPTTYPVYAPVTIVTGHFCHSLSQSSGIGTAPSQAPMKHPTAAPNTSSIGLYAEMISLHLALLDPCTYTRGKTARRAKCAELRRVCGMCVVIGAPNRTWMAARTGMERRERRRARNAVWNMLLHHQ